MRLNLLNQKIGHVVGKSQIILVHVRAKSLQLCPTLYDLQTIVHQALLSIGFSRQEYWSELPFPPPGNLPDPGIEPGSSTLQADSLLTESPGKPLRITYLRFLLHMLVPPATSAKSPLLHIHRSRD